MALVGGKIQIRTIYHLLIESAKKWIMECVNEHSVFSKSDFGEN